MPYAIAGEYFLEKQNEEKRIEVKNWVTVRKPVPPTSAATDYQLLKHSDSCADPAIGRREGNGQDSYIDAVALSCPQLILALRSNRCVDTYLAYNRKLRFGDPRRGKGKRGGLRVIYYWWDSGPQFWLFTVYDKDEMADLTSQQRKALKAMIKAELEARRKP